jgi:hypothetical protein
MIRWVLTVMIALAVLAAPAGAQDKDKPARKDDSYIKVEAKGKLMTGIMAIGGETTGVEIKTSAGNFELELDKKQMAQADKLNEKTVIVTGTLYVKKGVTRGQRTIVKVQTLKEAK